MKPQTLTLTCIGQRPNGDGIVDYKGNQIDVSNLLTSEKTLIKISQDGRQYKAQLLKRLSDAPARVKPPCPYFERCGGCQLQHMSIAAQSQFKQKLVAKHLKSFGKIKPIISMADPKGYRNKSHHTFSLSKKGNIIYGLYENYSHKLVAIDKCYIHQPIADDIAETVRQFMVKQNIAPYDEDSKTGVIRHLLTRVAQGSGEVLVAIIIGAKELPKSKQLVDTLLLKHPQITTIVLSVNAKKTSMVMGKSHSVLYGKGEIVDDLMGKQFVLSADSFYQINSQQMKALYNHALNIAKIKPGDTVLDAYCGVGTISLLAASKAKQVDGVENNAQAIKDAKRNAAINQTGNVTFIEADAADYIKNLKTTGTYSHVIIDPPRAGCSKDFIDGLIAHKPNTIIYISCNPQTQARDLKQLTRAGYKVGSIQPVDMFVMTGHVETVVLMSRVEKE